MNRTDVFSSNIPNVYLSAQDCVNKISLSKGGQSKGYRQGFWYKADCIGYEGFAETVASRIMNLLNVNMPCIRYDVCKIITPRSTLLGCVSQSYLSEGDSEIPLVRLVSPNFDTLTAKDKIASIVDTLAGIDLHLVDQLSCLFQFDRLIGNMDRHLYNIIIRTHSAHNDIILFDNGDSCTCDIMYDFPKEYSLEQCLTVNTAKPLLTSFDTQCELLKSYSSFELQALWDHLVLSDIKEVIPDWLFSRVKMFLQHQFHLYLHTKLNII